MTPDRDTLDLILDLLTLGHQLRVVAVGIVNKAAVVGIQGLGLDRASVDLDGVGELLDPLEESCIAHGAVMLYIHNDAWGLVVLGKEDSVHQELEALKSLVPAPDEALWFVSPDLEDEVSFPKLFLDFHEEAEFPENSLQDFFGRQVHGKRV